jgi:heme/copper-type cytochrome/quinol oxidase subunit 1
LNGLAIIGFAVLCLAVEYAADDMGFRRENLFLQFVYWLLVAAMTIGGASLTLGSPLLVLAIVPALWLKYTKPQEWRQVELVRDRQGNPIVIVRGISYRRSQSRSQG